MSSGIASSTRRNPPCLRKTADALEKQGKECLLELEVNLGYVVRPAKAAQGYTVRYCLDQQTNKPKQFTLHLDVIRRGTEDIWERLYRMPLQQPGWHYSSSGKKKKAETGEQNTLPFIHQ